MTAVAFYVTPFEIVSRLLAIPSAIAGASFPEFTSLNAKNTPSSEIEKFFKRNVLLVVGLLVPPVLIVFVFAQDILSAWVSPEFAAESYVVMRIMAIGVIINGAAYIPFAFVQGIGRSDVTAKFHLFELVIYIPMLIVLLGTFGITGAAVAWCFRVTLDAILLFAYSRYVLRHRP